jgi:hypothetical protein
MEVHDPTRRRRHFAVTHELRSCAAAIDAAIDLVGTDKEHLLAVEVGLGQFNAIPWTRCNVDLCERIAGEGKYWRVAANNEPEPGSYDR